MLREIAGGPVMDEQDSPFDKEETIWHFYPMVFLNELKLKKIKLNHETTSAKGMDGKVSWCASFVNWYLPQTK